VTLFGTLLADMLAERGKPAGDMWVVYCHPTFEVTVVADSVTPAYGDRFLVRVVKRAKHEGRVRNLDAVLDSLSRTVAPDHALVKVPKGFVGGYRETGFGEYDKIDYVYIDPTCYGLNPPYLEKFRVTEKGRPSYEDQTVKIEVLYNVINDVLKPRELRRVQEDPL
jgi:hypothetical protein